jgi:hypothetical protein
LSFEQRSFFRRQPRIKLVPERAPVPLVVSKSAFFLLFSRANMVARWVFNSGQHIHSYFKIFGVRVMAECAIILVKQWLMIMIGVIDRSRL